jgi:hypothetical protein
MAKKELIGATPTVAAEFNKLFGQPPLLKADHKAIYSVILEGLAEEEKPRSFLARILIRDVADLVYQRLWLRDLGPGLIRQAHKNRLRTYAAVAGLGRDPPGERSAQTQEVLTKLTEAENGPVDEAAVFQMWIGNYERLQSLLAAADKKLSDTLKLLDEYRHGLGQRVHQVADEIVDTEFEEGALRASEQQVATPSSSIAAVEAPVPSTQGMLPRPAVEPLVSPAEISASSRPVSLRERRRLHSAGVQRRRRSASSSPGRAQSNSTSSGDAGAGKVADSVNTGPTGNPRSSANDV